MARKILVIGFLFFGLLQFSSSQLEPFELDEILNGKFSARSFNGVWITGDTFYYSEDNNIKTFNAATHKNETLLASSILDRYERGRFSGFSSDQNYILIRYNDKAIFRHSTIAQYTVYDRKNNRFYDLGNKKHLQLVQWAPVGNGLTYVLDNNIYYVPQPENSNAPQQVTTDGEPGIIYNGVPDWVYEEEVLGSGTAMWFSPDGTKLAYATFNDKDVEVFTYFIYGEAGNVNYQYPKEINLKYPKVNTTNPNFTLTVVDFSKISDLKIQNILPEGLDSRDHVLFDVTWPTNDEVVAVVENRIQNEATVTRCNVGTNLCAVENEFKEENGWIELQAPKYSSDGKQALMLLSQPEGKDAFTHLVLFDTVTGIKRLTFGERVVTSIIGWDEAKNRVYYMGSVADFPSQQQVYYVNTATLEDVCITCTFITPEGPCLYARATFSKDYSYFAEICSGPGPTFVAITKTEDVNSLYIYEGNEDLRQKLSRKLLPVIRDFKVEVGDGFVARVRLLLPADLNEHDIVQYPMVVYVYAGPDSNQIKDSFSLGFQSYIVTKRKHIYAYIDGRGSGRKGDKMRFSIYKRMGTVEVQDQISVTKCLRDTLPYIDPERIGIWGWSYGGFSTAWALVYDTENVFKFGLSVAPVSDFMLYDTIYTERYMRLPTSDDNEVGYNNTNVMHAVEGFRNKLFLLIHGNADDNVHYQQAMLLAKELEHADIMFFQLSYPDENHSLNNVSPHLYHSIDRFWARSFDLPIPVYRTTQTL